MVSAADVSAFARHMDAYLSRLHDPNVAVRRGYASALGALPSQLLQGRVDEVRSVCVCVCVHARLYKYIQHCMCAHWYERERA